MRSVEGEFGGSVALSSGGNLALIGGPLDNEQTGGAWLFARSGSTWSQDGGKLTGEDELGKARFGASAALSGEGGDALIGGPRDNPGSGGGEGAAWAFNDLIPSVSKVAPRSGSASGGTAVTITGSGFSTASEVRFGQTKATSFTVESDTSISAVSPTGTGTVDVTVSTPAGVSAATASDRFQYVEPEWSKNGRLIGASRAGIFGYGQFTLASTQQELGAECVNLMFGSVANETREGGPARGYAQILGWWASGHAAMSGHAELGSSCRIISAGAGAGSSGEAWITPEGPVHTVEQQGEICINKERVRLSECPIKAGEAGAERVLTAVATEVSRESPSLPWNAELVPKEGGVHLRIGVPTEAGRSCAEAPAPAGCVKMTLVAPTLGWQLPVEGEVEPALVNGVHNALSPSTLEFEGAGSGALSSPSSAISSATLSGGIKILGSAGQELITAQ